MSNKPISLSVALVGVTAFGWAVACSSSSPTGSSGSSGTTTGTSGTTSGTGNSGSATGTTGTSTGTTGTASGTTGTSTGSTDAGSGTIPAGLVIDNQSNTGGEISRIPPAGSGAHPGTWFSYVANGAPLTQVTPPQGSSPFPFQPISPAVTPAGGPTISIAACLNSTGFQGYSVGDGFHFEAELPADAGDGGIATPITFDASAYSGISFWAISTGPGAGALSLRVKIPDDQTDGDPFADSACKGDSGSNALCFDDFSQDLTGGTGITSTWTQFTVPFATTIQHGFGAAFAGIHTNAIYGVEFEIEGLGPYAADAGIAPGFDFCIAQIAFTQ
jgi:hypothetical protein